MKAVLVLCVSLALFSFGHCGAPLVSFAYAIDGHLTGSGGTGSGTATLNTATNEFCYQYTYGGLTGTVTNAHFHGPAAVDGSAGPVVNVGPVASPVGPTCVTVTGAVATHLLSELVYMNIHSTTFAGGEVRGHLFIV